MTKVSASQHQKIVDMYIAGSTQLSVAAAFGLSGPRIHQILKRHGIGRDDSRRAARTNTGNYRYVADPSQREAMAEMYRSGSTLAQVGAEFGITRERVRQLIKRLGVTRDDGGQCIARFLMTDDKISAVRASNEKQESRIRSVWSMSMEDYRAHVAEFGSSGSKGSPMQKYVQQRTNAKKRGLIWDFNFAQWWDVWQESGKWGERGRTSGHHGYVMARWGDGTAPYSADTVYICTQSQNAKDGYIVAPAAERNAKRIENGRSKAGTGLGYTVCKRGKRVVFIAMFKGMYLGRFPAAEQARAAYLAAAAAAKP